MCESVSTHIEASLTLPDVKLTTSVARHNIPIKGYHIYDYSFDHNIDRCHAGSYVWNRSDVTICKKERFFRPIYKSESKFLSERINAAKAKVSPQDMPAKMVWSFFDFWGKALAKWGYHAWQYHRTLLENPPTEIHKREPRDWPNPREGFEDSFLIEDASVSNLWPFGVESNILYCALMCLVNRHLHRRNHIRYFNI